MRARQFEIVNIMLIEDNIVQILTEVKHYITT